MVFPVMTVRIMPSDAVDDLGGEGMDRHMGAVRTRDHRAWNFVVVFIEGLVAYRAQQVRASRGRLGMIATTARKRRWR